MKTKTTNGDSIREMLSSIGFTIFGENIAADNSTPTSLTKLAGIWIGGREHRKGGRNIYSFIRLGSTLSTNFRGDGGSLRSY